MMKPLKEKISITLDSDILEKYAARPRWMTDLYLNTLM